MNTDNYNSDFRGTFGNANAGILIRKNAARARVRKLAKDDPHGKAAVRCWLAHHMTQTGI